MSHPPGKRACPTCGKVHEGWLPCAKGPDWVGITGTAYAVAPEIKQYIADEFEKMTGLTTHESGATSSTLDVDWSLLVWPVIRRMAVAMHRGAGVHGRDNWKQGVPADVLLNHAIEHIHQHQAGDASEDHLAHALCRLMMLASQEP